LAEVLITLAIIGVIAVITIPSIIANHQKTELESRFAKTYKTLMHMVNMSVAEHGSFENWEWKDSWTSQEMADFTHKYFLPHLNVVKYCQARVGVYGCFSDVTYKFLDGTDWAKLNAGSVPSVVLGDGSLIQFGFISNCIQDNGRCLSLRVDINGHKKPNIYGLDAHLFNFFPQTGKFLPGGSNMDGSYDKEHIDEYCNGGATTNNGATCAAKIVAEGFKINYKY